MTTDEPETGYRPTPLDVSGVTIPDDLRRLVEVLAENAHDVWAARRLAEGWRWGATHDAVAGTHPNLVRYADLDEQAKDMDRDMALGNISALLALGYEIRRPEG